MQREQTPLDVLIQAQVDDGHPLSARLSHAVPYRDRDDGTTRRTYRPSSKVLSTADTIRRIAHASPTPANLHALGISQIFLREIDDAIDSLQRAAANDPTNVDYTNDLAGARLIRGMQTDDSADYVAACDELYKRVLISKSRAPTLLFNLALAFECLENRVAAERIWRTYLSADPESSWAMEARTHLRRLQQKSPMIAGDDCSDPYVARRRAENEETVRWAQAALHNDPTAAKEALEALQRTANALQRCSQDPAISALTSAIGRMSNDAQERSARAILAYQAAGQLARIEQGSAVITAYSRAVRKLRDASLPLYRAAACYYAFQLYYAANYDAARRVLTATPRDPDESPAWAAQLDWVEGMVYLATGSPFRSLELYQQALTRFEKTGESRNIAAMQMLIAENLTALGANSEAWPHRRRALAELARNGDKRRELVALNEAAEAALEMGRPFVARAYQESAMVAGHETADPVDATYLVLWLALINDRCGLHDAADVGIRQARLLASRLDAVDVRKRVDTDVDLAEGVICQRHDAARAIAVWSSAINALRAYGSHYRSAQLLLARARLYRRLGQLDRAQADLTDGMREAESQRQRVGDEELRTSYFGRAADLFDESIALLIDRGEVAAAYGIAERRRERTLLDAVEQRLTRSPVAARDVMRALRPNEALLEYAVLPDRIVRWTVTAADTRMSVVPLQEGELRSSFSGLRSSDRTAQRRALEQLHVLLIPHEVIASGARHLIVIPDSLLAGVPFAALLDRDAHHLIERCSIEAAPSASLFLDCRNRERIVAYRATANWHAFVFGETRAQPERSLPALPGAALELQRAAKALATTPVIDGDASRERFLRDAPIAGLIYVAGHAITDVVPSHPAVVVAHGLLSVDDVRRMRLQSRHVVLAACGTGFGSGEGITSLAKAFMAAGAPGITATLWPVDDDSAQELLTRYIHAIAEGDAPAEALRSAQLDVMRRNPFGNPLAWGTFQVYGSASLSTTGAAKIRLTDENPGIPRAYHLHPSTVPSTARNRSSRPESQNAESVCVAAAEAIRHFLTLAALGED